ncbi:MAG: hypothetical protein KAX39_02275 [candidate division Zixibacteria bacterium]|nr:hypothetical protein [candidate division Zixibacteria bacterium]
MGFSLSESHGGEEPTNTVISELAFFGFALIESARILGLEIGDGFDRKNAISYQMFKPYDSILNLSFQVEGLWKKFGQYFFSY